MMHFDTRYKNLNDNQRLAVDTIDGPVLVLAGPGTGKTELLGMRVANILKKTDTLPENILCLTFTESGAQNMRNRLSQLIGQASYRVHISTYHGFGAELIRKFPEYFLETRMQEPVDDLGRHQILTEIIESMSYLNPLKQTRHHLGDLISTISEVKRAGLGSQDIRQVAHENLTLIEKVSENIQEIFRGWTRMPSKVDAAIPYFRDVLEALRRHQGDTSVGHVISLGRIASDTLEKAISESIDSQKTTALTAWKNKWLAKNSSNHFILAGSLESRRIEALADVLEQYQGALEHKGLYDFDDMILRSLKSLETNLDLKYTLQEQYQYLLLDEFQDTNIVQLRLVELLTDNPVNEGRPNVLAVGDDDQAIYAFQGAQYSNMLDFYGMYNDVQVINLKENYRSHQDILTAAQNISTQIGERLNDKFEGTVKELVASRKDLPKKAHITRNHFKSDIAEFHWIARKVQDLIATGTDPKEIAVLAPQHRYLEPVVAYLNNLSIPVSYEKRENIFEAPVVKQLVSISRLIVALKSYHNKLADSLWPEVLSYDFWQIPAGTIWKHAWSVNDSRDKNSTWSKSLLEDDATANIALFILTLASKADAEPLEDLLDAIIGTTSVDVHEAETAVITSPLRGYYASMKVLSNQPQLFYETLSHLKILRERLRDFQKAHDTGLSLRDFIRFVDMYEAANQKILNTSPYNQHKDAVQLMTVFKAKGLEFEHVFLVSCNDEVWGGSARGNSNKLTLPQNFSHIRHAGANDDERLRLLFVALTRAKVGLHLTSFNQTFSGKMTKRLSYLDEQEGDDGTIAGAVLPTGTKTIQYDENDTPELKLFDIDWHHKHAAYVQDTSLRALLEHRLQSYRLSPTHLNSFLSVDYGGPEDFFYRTILRFPEAPSLSSQFGNAMHDTMEWLQHQLDATNILPETKEIVAEFYTFLKKYKLTEIQEKIEHERGEKALTVFMSQRKDTFHVGDKAEENFVHEGVFIKNAHIDGKIDKLEINKNTKEITVVDYKTGKPHQKWSSDAKLHRYKQQLYFYKILIENSAKYRGYTVTKGRIEFLEPDEHGVALYLDLDFDEKTVHRTKRLILRTWEHVQTLNFPDTSGYEKTIKGIIHFEDTLLTNTQEKV
jgi:DNA helicase-2/ATP-dependent DNA helicase PcrA